MDRSRTQHYHNRGASKRSNLSLPLFIQKSSIYRKLRNLRRNKKLRNDFSNKIPIKSSTRITPGRIKPIFPIIILVLICFGILNVAKYFSFNPIPYNEESLGLANKDNRLTIAFIGLDDRVSEYEFADMIVLVDMDFSGNTAKLYTINSSFATTTSRNYNLRTAWNNMPDANKAEEYLNLLTELTGIKIDNYIIALKSDLNDMFMNRKMTIHSNANYALGARIIGKGEYIDAEDSIDSIIGNDKRNNDLLIFQQLFFKTFLDELKNQFSLYSLFLDSDQFLNTFKTGLSKQDFINFILALNGQEIIFNSKAIMFNELGVANNNDPDILRAKSLEFNENISQNFRDFEVLKEQVQIEIYNSTAIPGLATKYTKLIQNRGGNVIKPGNYSELSSITKIYIDIKKVNSYRNTTNLILDLLPLDAKIFDISEYRYNYSGDLILILGEDILL